MYISIVNKVVEIIYCIKNRGVVIKNVDNDFYEVPFYLNDLIYEEEV